MNAFRVLCLRYTVEVRTPIEFGYHAGAQIRGGLYAALMEMMHQPGVHDHPPSHRAACPVCRMMKRENPESGRGQDIPRPFGIIPPPMTVLDQSFRAEVGTQFSFGLHLYGDTASNYKLITLAVAQLGRQGVGYQRGRYHVTDIKAVNPLTGETESLVVGGQSRMPTLIVTADHIRKYAGMLPGDQLTLEFQTPLRLVYHKQLVKTPQFRPFVARLLERLEGLEREYANGASWKQRYLELTQHAEGVRLIEDETQWVEMKGGSRRQKRILPISGLVGRATYEGDLARFNEWLVWGTLLQVGKNVVKGSGVYHIKD